MKNTKQNIIKAIAAAFAFVAIGFDANAQLNSKIKVYFNHPVNNAVSSGTNAIYTVGFADTIAAYINRAKYTVDIAQYDYSAYSTDPIAVISTACNNAYTRGVTVRWIHDGTATNTGLSLLNSGIHTVGSSTVGMASGYISHNKFMIIDRNVAANAIVCTSSMDWSDEMISEDYNNMVFIQDQKLAKAYTAQFNQMWGDTTATPGTGVWGVNKTASTTTSFTVNGTPIQVYFSPKDGAEAQLENVINSATKEMYFGIYDFTRTTPANDMSTKYTSTGFTGFGVMDQYSTTGGSTGPYTTLDASGVLGTTNLKVYTGSYIYHNKMICVDPGDPTSDPVVGTGSYNWTSAGTNTNDENFMVIHDATVANLYYQSLCGDFAGLGGAACTAFTTGVAKYDLGTQQVAVYPNPMIDALNIELKNAAETLSVRVTDQLGKVVLESKANLANEMQLNTNTLSAGIYFVTVTSGNTIYTQKIVK